MRANIPSRTKRLSEVRHDRPTCDRDVEGMNIFVVALVLTP